MESGDQLEEKYDAQTGIKLETGDIKDQPPNDIGGCSLLYQRS